MNFLKNGQKVIILRNNGPLLNEAKNKYYYGGETYDVPLLSKGKIIGIKDIKKSKIQVELSFGKEWYFHNSEIGLLDDTNFKKFDFDIKEDLHPIFGLAEQNITLIHKGDVYVVGEKNRDAKNHVKSGKFIKRNYELTKIGALADFDRIVKNRIKQHEEKIKNHFIKSFFKNGPLSELLKNAKNSKKIEDLIYTEIFPYLGSTNNDENLTNILDFEESKQKKVDVEKQRKIEDLAEALDGGVKSIIKSLKEVSDKGKLDDEKLDKLLLGENDVVPKREFHTDFSLNIDTKFENYILTEHNFLTIKKLSDDTGFFKKKFHPYLINIKNETFEVTKSKNIEKLINKYFERVIDGVKLTALQEEFTKDKIMNYLQDENIDFDDITYGRKLQNKDFGSIKLKNGNHLVYVSVPAYGVKSIYDDSYYYFKETKIGIQVFLNSNNKIKYGEDILMVENNNHPFLHHSKRDYASVCMGYGELPNSGKTVGETISKKLFAARSILIHGYMSEHYLEEYKLRRNNLQYMPNQISKKKLLEKNVMIIGDD